MNASYGRDSLVALVGSTPQTPSPHGMAYAIIRIGKMKSASAIAGQGDHVERLRETPNAEAELLKLNQRLAGTADPWADVQTRFDECGITPQRNSVLAIDVFISASPEHFQSNHPSDPNWKAFQERALEFLREEYGRENIVHAVAHHDELSPHLHAIITPITTKTIKVGRKVKTERTENRLCARDWLGGDRTTLSKLQDRFANKVADLGLERGIKGSRATHTEVKKFYTIMNEVVEKKAEIDRLLAPISVDQAVSAVQKPTGLGLLTPHTYAQAQVRAALERVQTQINTTNKISQQLQQGLTVQLQTPAAFAIMTKANTIESQAVAALTKLGYRLDEHGGLVNLLEERKNALRAKISQSVKGSTNMDELKALLEKKGIRLTFNREVLESYKGKSLRSSIFHDDKGPISGADLGSEFQTASLHEQFALNLVQKQKSEKAAQEAQAKAEREAQKKAAIEAEKKKEAAKNAAKTTKPTEKTQPRLKETKEQPKGPRR